MTNWNIGGVAAALTMFCITSVHAEQRRLVYFTGSITPEACIVIGSGDRVVNLAPVFSTELTSYGSTAGLTNFTIDVTCPKGIGKVRAYFQDGVTVDQSTGNLLMIPVPGRRSASNVEVQLRNADNSAIFIGQRPTMQQVTVDPDANGNATLAYQAQYYATGKAAAGLVNSRVTYVLETP
jgi:major type 1 subunit fimbrin (pilin)